MFEQELRELTKAYDVYRRAVVAGSKGPFLKMGRDRKLAGNLRGTKLGMLLASTVAHTAARQPRHNKAEAHRRNTAPFGRGKG